MNEERRETRSTGAKANPCRQRRDGRPSATEEGNCYAEKNDIEATLGDRRDRFVISPAACWSVITRPTPDGN
jgi:hypothetical protein